MKMVIALMKDRRPFRALIQRAGLCVFALTCLGNGVVVSQETQIPDWLEDRMSLRTSNRRDNGDMIALVRPLTEAIGESVVQVVSVGKAVALGVIVSEDGYVLTKRSELSVDPIRVRLASGQLLPARVAAVRRVNDLALLRIDEVGKPLKPASFVDVTPPVGAFLVSAGRGGNPIGLGSVGVGSRKVEHSGRLGVQLYNSDGKATVEVVLPASGAEAAGVEPGDKILAINGREESNSSSVMRVLREMFPGENVRLTILRGSEKMNLDAKIRDLGVMLESENDSKVNGQRSARLSGFEKVIQHDTVLDPSECGGPVVDSQGRVIGINIARAGRVVSYALPASVVMQDVSDMLNDARSSR